mmetsp:Transcript_68778/g.212687  ORF Transcript_68778/g.212687 Transcript_68778/m.212687 type:complete len:203 (+) Transcript_68778:614-1222(+)
MVPTRSTVETGSSTTRPCKMPGPATTSGTRVDTSQGLALPKWPQSPRCSPWSEVTMTRVLFRRSRCSRKSTNKPIKRSRRLIKPAYWRREPCTISGASNLLSVGPGKSMADTVLFSEGLRMNGGCGDGKPTVRYQGLLLELRRCLASIISAFLSTQASTESCSSTGSGTGQLKPHSPKPTACGETTPEQAYGRQHSPLPMPP